MLAAYRRIKNALLPALLGLALAANEAPPAPVTLTTKIPLPGVQGRLDHMTADLYHARLFLAAAGNDSVEVIDVRTNTLLAPIHEVSEPHGLAYVKATERLFVTNGGDGTLRQFDGTTMKLVSSLRLGRDPGTIRVDAARNRLYVGYGEGAIAVLDLTGKRVADIALKSHPESFQLAEAQSRLFVNLPDSHMIAVVDTATNKVVAEWPEAAEGQENFAMALDEETRRVFVAFRRPARLVVHDMDSGEVLARLPTVGDADELFYDSIHGRIYVLGGRGQLAIYAQKSATQYAELDLLPTVAGTRTGLFVGEWNRLYVAVRDFSGHKAEIRIYAPQ